MLLDLLSAWRGRAINQEQRCCDLQMLLSRLQYLCPWLPPLWGCCSNDLERSVSPRLPGIRLLASVPRRKYLFLGNAKFPVRLETADCIVQIWNKGKFYECDVIYLFIFFPFYFTSGSRLINAYWE